MLYKIDRNVYIDICMYRKEMKTLCVVQGSLFVYYILFNGLTNVAYARICTIYMLQFIWGKLKTLTKKKSLLTLFFFFSFTHETYINTVKLVARIKIIKKTKKNNTKI